MARCAVVALGLAISVSANAHSGAVDATGCHKERHTGKVHCHPERRAAPKPSATRVPAVPPDAPRRRVKRAVDGDTVVLDGGERVRLIGVNTPEMKDARQDVRYFAKRAAVFLEDMVAGKSVRLEFDHERHDRYGRLLAYLYLDDGRCANAEIVRAGMGFAFTRYPFRYLAYFRDLERAARLAHRGLFAQER